MSHAASTSPRRLIRFSASAPRRRLYCFPFAGGSAATYRDWPTMLTPGTEVAVLRFPGREPASPDEPLATVEAMTEFALEAIVSDIPQPFALFGHSMGAAVAYEVASRLERAGGRMPEHLFVSGRRSPSVPGTTTTTAALPDAEFVEAVDRTYGGIPDALRDEPDLLALFLPVLRADLAAIETYRRLSDHRIGCPVTVLGGRDDGYPHPDELAGWTDAAASEVAVHVLAGDHFYINHHGDAVSRLINSRWPA